MEVKNPFFEILALTFASLTPVGEGKEPKHIMSGNIDQLDDMLLQRIVVAAKKLNLDLDTIDAEGTKPERILIAWLTTVDSFRQYYVNRNYIDHAKSMVDVLTVLYSGYRMDSKTPETIVKLVAESLAAMKGLVKAIEGVKDLANSNIQRCYKLVGELSHMPEILGSQSRTTNTQPDVMKRILKFLKSNGLDPAHPFLTTQEKADLKAADPEARKEYDALYKEYKAVPKLELENYVRSTGKKMVPYREATTYLKSINIDIGDPPGFGGMIDMAGRWYTLDGKLISSKPTLSTYAKLEMRTKEEEKLGLDAIFRGIKNLGQKNMSDTLFYTVEYQVNAAKTKYAAVKNTDWQSVRAKWLKMLHAPDTYMGKGDKSEVEFFCACILEIIWRSLHRVGTTRGGNDKGTGYGISTLMCSMISFTSDGGFIMKYDGKKDGPQYFKQKGNEAVDGAPPKITENLVKALKYLLAFDWKRPYTKKEIWVIPFKGSPTANYGLPAKHISSTEVNRYLSQLGVQEPSTVHNIRTYKGTKLFNELALVALKKVKTLPIEYSSPKAPMDGKRLLASLGLKVGKELAHFKTDASGKLVTVAETCLKSYVDVMAQIEFLEHYGTRLPAHMQKFLGVSDDEDSEVASRIHRSAIKFALREKAARIRKSAGYALGAAEAVDAAETAEAEADAIPEESDEEIDALLAEADEAVVGADNAMSESPETEGTDGESTETPVTEGTVETDEAGMEPEKIATKKTDEPVEVDPSKAETVELDTRFFESTFLEGGIYGAGNYSPNGLRPA